MLSDNIAPIREDAGTERQTRGRGAEMHSPSGRGWTVGEARVSPPLSALRRGLPSVSVPDSVKGLSSGWPWGARAATLTWVIPAKVRVKPAGQDTRASDYASLYIRLLSQD